MSAVGSVTMPLSTVAQVLLRGVSVCSRLPQHASRGKFFHQFSKFHDCKFSTSAVSRSVYSIERGFLPCSNRSKAVCLAAVGNSHRNRSLDCIVRNKSSGIAGEVSQPQNEKKYNTQTLLESWFYEVSPRGSMEASLPFNTIIKPLPPQEYPNMNKVILQLHFDSKAGQEVPTAHQLSEICDLYDQNVTFDKDKANMNLSYDVTSGVVLPVVCHLQVPLQFSLSVTMLGDSDVTIERMESDAIVVNTDRGDCNLKSIKCGSASAFCRSGNITSKSNLLGNVLFHTGRSGSIRTDKLQGSSISCETEMGSMNVKSLYTGTATFRSDAGNVHLGHCHGQICMQAENSHFKIESLDGDLDVSLQSGSVDVHFSHHEKADIEITSGDVSLSFQEGASTDLNLDCAWVTVDENIDLHLAKTSLPRHTEGFIGERGKSQTNVRTLSGSVHLKQLDWIQTTKLASFMEREKQD
ncbi:protein FAM185A [Aplysia californica]|uniref:Protein FAM185A n=1 Tax=Aplysia californica TaxID=6500 RepID=A0ABM1VUR5_APLCA|nr:protein FAM185A [Aplysia californica]XP_035826159.1 protein FAM185A [Aplysia californica]